MKSVRNFDEKAQRVQDALNELVDGKTIQQVLDGVEYTATAEFAMLQVAGTVARDRWRARDYENWVVVARLDTGDPVLRLGIPILNFVDEEELVKLFTDVFGDEAVL